MTLQEQAWSSVSPANVLKELQSKHQIKVDGDKLIVMPAPSPRLSFQIRRYKPKLLELLGHGQTRGTPTQRGYNYRWQQYRIAYLQANPLCAHCKRREATQVDHIKAVNGADDPLFWEGNNHQALCSSCHSRKTIREDGGFGR